MPFCCPYPTMYSALPSMPKPSRSGLCRLREGFILISDRNELSARSEEGVQCPLSSLRAYHSIFYRRTASLYNALRDFPLAKTPHPKGIRRSEANPSQGAAKRPLLLHDAHPFTQLTLSVRKAPPLYHHCVRMPTLTSFRHSCPRYRRTQPSQTPCGGTSPRAS